MGGVAGGTGVAALLGGTAVDPNTGDVYVAILFGGSMVVDGQTYVGEEEGDSMVLRLAAADGSIEAVRHWGNVGQDHIRHLTTLPDGDVVVSALATGSVDFGLGPTADGPGQDAILARLNPDLSPVWAHAYASTGNAGGLGLITSKAGDLVYTVSFQGSIDLGSGSLTGEGASGAIARISPVTGLATEAVPLSGYNAPFWLAEAGDGSLLVAGSYTYGFSVGGVSKQSGGGGNSQADPVLVKMSADLQTVDWIQFAGESKKWESFGGLVLSDDDTVIVGGYFHEQLDIPGCSFRTSAGESDSMFMKRKL